MTQSKPISAYFGHHKCASDWMLRVLSQFCVQAGLAYFHTHWPLRLPLGYETQPMFAEKIAASREFAATGDYNLLIATNADSELVERLSSRGLRGFHIIRDPRDVIVSGYFSHLESHTADPLANPWLLEHRERLRAVDQEAGLLLEIEYAASHMLRLAEWEYNNPAILEARYETVTADPYAEVRRLLEFSGIDLSPHEELFRRVMEMNSFRNLAGGRNRGEANPASHLRKGLPGDHKNYFTPTVQAAFHARYPDLVNKLGYS